MSYTDKQAQESLAHWRTKLATVWDQHSGNKSEWIMALKIGDFVRISGHKKGSAHPFRTVGKVKSVTPSIEMVFVEPFNVYLPNMVGDQIPLLFNGKVARIALDLYHELIVEPDDDIGNRLGCPMDGHCGSEGFVEQRS